MKAWIGIDPGGEGNFGLAVISGSKVTTRCVGCADQAIHFVRKSLKSAPDGIGIDAPLWWSSGRSSDRAADQWLRKTYKLSGGEVQTANSLRGAALVQGLMFLQRIRERFPGVPVTEAHPNALRVAIGATSWNRFCKISSIDVPLPATRKHEQDAVLAAFAAREGFEGRWARDLSRKRLKSEQDPKSYWLGPVRYFWPHSSI